jgi:hypothetical protein
VAHWPAHTHRGAPRGAGQLRRTDRRFAGATVEAEHGRGFGAKNLRHMLRFGEVFEAEEIVYALSRQLSWTHLHSLIYIDDPLKGEFYRNVP